MAAAIVGAALSDCGRVDDKSAFELHFQAASRAVADAGLTKADIDGFMSHGTGVLPPIEVAEYLGLRPRWIDSSGVGGATWEFYNGTTGIRMATWGGSDWFFGPVPVDAGPNRAIHPDAIDGLAAPAFVYEEDAYGQGLGYASWTP